MTALEPHITITNHTAAIAAGHPPPRPAGYVVAAYDVELDRFHLFTTQDRESVGYIFEAVSPSAFVAAFTVERGAPRWHRATPAGQRAGDREAWDRIATRAEWTVAHSLGVREHAEGVAGKARAA